MSRLVDYFVRFAVMIFGFFCAALAASAFLHLILAGIVRPTPEETSFLMSGPVFVTIPFVALFVGYFAFLPAMPFLFAAEFLGKRDWLFHALSGGAVSLAVAALYLMSGGEAGRSADAFLAAIFVGAGLVGGIAYWIVAGRSAGLWLESPEINGRTPSGP